VRITVEEGRLVERPTPDVSGMDRRAFGEFEGLRGELASYAMGWTTCDDANVAKMTIGIGAGNAGGATFHAVVFQQDGGYAFSLVDEPFEDVPEGGPHLTAQEAREHPDLPFIWFVADCVMQRDRRAWWMRHWLLGTLAIQTPQVFRLAEPILRVSNDIDDELWQLAGAGDGGDDSGGIAHLHHAVDSDATLLDVLDLALGEQATRTDAGAPWTRGACLPSQ
jgi:hypothetical protein